MDETLVSCEWLNDAISSGKNTAFVLLDVTWSSTQDSQKAYETTHIPGALFFDALPGPHTDLLPRNITSPEKFEQQCQEAGIDNGSRIILYSNTDAKGFFTAGRMWWTFRYFGHDNVGVLNGGLGKWTSLGYEPTANPTAKPKLGNFKANVNESLKKTFDQMSGLQSNSIQICDTRPPTAFSNGHIPGAVSVPLPNMLDMQAGILKSSEGLKKEFTGASLDLTKPVIFYCNSGMTSATVTMAASMLGCKEHSLYMGGFVEWKGRVSEDRIAK